MKNNQWYVDFFSLLSMSILTLVIVVACSSNEYSELDDEIENIELAEIVFENYFLGTYIPNNASILQLDGEVMNFDSKFVNITLSTNTDNSLYLDILLDGNSENSTINRILFIENNIVDITVPILSQETNNSSPQKFNNRYYVQEIIPDTSTNIFLQNVVMYIDNEPIIYNDMIELIINNQNGELFLDDVNIAIKL